MQHYKMMVMINLKDDDDGGGGGGDCHDDDDDDDEEDRETFQLCHTYHPSFVVPPLPSLSLSEDNDSVRIL